MKKFLLFIKKNIISFLSVLVISFLLSFMIVNSYNQNNAYYVAKVNISNIETININSSTISSAM